VLETYSVVLEVEPSRRCLRTGELHSQELEVVSLLSCSLIYYSLLPFHLQHGRMQQVDLTDAGPSTLDFSTSGTIRKRSVLYKLSSFRYLLKQHKMGRGEVIDILTFFIIVMISQVYTCLFKFVQLIICKQYSNKPIVKK
jgi:hypothetical protein